MIVLVYLILGIVWVLSLLNMGMAFSDGDEGHGVVSGLTLILVSIAVLLLIIFP